MTTILETFVDSTTFLPPDLQRHLNTIKALDEKCALLSDVLQRNVNQLLLMPSAHTTGVTEEYLDLSKRVESDQRQLLQFADEKVLVAQQVYDLIEMYALDVEKNIDDLEGDLRISGAIDNGGMDYYGSPGFSLDASHGRNPRVEDWTAVGPSPLDALASPLPDLVLKRPVSSLIPTFTVKKEHKYEDLKTALASSSSSAAAETAAATHGARRAAAAAARVQNHGLASTVRTLAYTAPAAVLKQGGAETDNEKSGGAAIKSEDVEMQAPPAFLGQRPEGLQDAAPKLQAAGKYLYPEDINEALVGRHAELFWPDDSMWYLIEIQHVNMDTKMSRIMYMTGELEELDLAEIARDMHMSIINSQAKGV
ncbi:hypothetical protein CEUSTIGMA_g562.t1 [Chlamydomonas eustigma]|uniref:Inhibitor of growth protein N-terminal histone-binding domain-containing protein n=1 Tax=Chlamydomonas eustigma TaxID=1157962 RepID=A0A250WQY9_9CHLO|nr:hypothetical protein CEUSTIGMA_g562.t1 [Chlamydomonas eustigma]|eukprot:GAX73109.1 hypothetical protein CEUSTIGMA_g562.t1 [Chlamydomonas eustigma]